MKYDEEDEDLDLDEEDDDPEDEDEEPEDDEDDEEEAESTTLKSKSQLTVRRIGHLSKTSKALARKLASLESLKLLPSSAKTLKQHSEN